MRSGSTDRRRPAAGTPAGDCWPRAELPAAAAGKAARAAAAAAAALAASLLAALAFLAAAGGARADVSPVTFQCLEESAARFQVPLAMILMIMDTESGSVGRASPNPNGSRDLGPMQVNTWWLGRLAPFGVTEELLRDDGCVNVAVAAWILRGALSEGGGPLAAVASYHSPKPGRGRIYLKAVLERAGKLDVERTLARANASRPAGRGGAPAARKAKGKDAGTAAVRSAGKAGPAASGKPGRSSGKAGLAASGKQGRSSGKAGLAASGKPGRSSGKAGLAASGKPGRSSGKADLAASGKPGRSSGKAGLAAAGKPARIGLGRRASDLAPAGGAPAARAR
ncbi:MAG: transglycosylase SLT domain-containing protein [Deltaproteobacteria bacterium]|jgi:hypothetical protein|nr:transglycosylase SLT domain-containing protein [Deltaproteobacteria bacterium]